LRKVSSPDPVPSSTRNRCDGGFSRLGGYKWRVMTLPTPLVEYVVAHELVHLREPRHTPRFWRLLGRILPDSTTRRERLAMIGGEL